MHIIDCNLIVEIRIGNNKDGSISRFEFLVGIHKFLFVFVVNK